MGQEITDTVVFVMPRDHELQFPAMSALQMFVDGYKERCRQTDASMGKVTYRLSYEAIMPKEDWEFFASVGYKVAQEPSELLYTQPSLVADMSDARLNSFINGGRHAAQVCGLITGVGVCPPFPRLKQVRIKRLGLPAWLVDPHLSMLIDAKDNEITGVLGKAGRETTLAAAMGLAVIEIVPDGRPRSWLSKWMSPLYHATSDNEDQIWRAKQSIEMRLTHVFGK